MSKETITENPSLNYIEKTGRHIELKFGFFGEDDEPMCAVYADETFILMIPKNVIDLLADEWFNLTVGWTET